MSQSINVEQNGAVLRISVQETQTLRSILAEKNIDPKDYIILVNGTPSTLDQEINEKDNVIILPRVKGGI